MTPPDWKFAKSPCSDSCLYAQLNRCRVGLKCSFGDDDDAGGIFIKALVELTKLGSPRMAVSRASSSNTILNLLVAMMVTSRSIVGCSPPSASVQCRSVPDHRVKSNLRRSAIMRHRTTALQCSKLDVERSFSVGMSTMSRKKRSKQIFAISLTAGDPCRTP